MGLTDAVQQAEEIIQIKTNQQQQKEVEQKEITSDIPTACTDSSSSVGTGAVQESIRLKDAGNDALGKRAGNCITTEYFHVRVINMKYIF